MFNPENLKDGAIAKLIRKVSAGEVLFEQGNMGKTMFVILSGTLILVEKGTKANRLIGTLNAGEILGEKAIIFDGPYRRSFSALAKTETVLIEIDENNLKTIMTKIPDFMIKMLRTISARLDKANELTRILQSTNPAERLALFIQHHAKYHGKKTTQGIEFALTTDEIVQTINSEKDVIEEGMKQLLTHKILVKNQDVYVLQDENALTQHIPALKERLAA